VGKIPYNFKQTGKLPLFSSQFEIQWERLHSKTIPNGFLDLKQPILIGVLIEFFIPAVGRSPGEEAPAGL